MLWGVIVIFEVFGVFVFLLLLVFFDVLYCCLGGLCIFCRFLCFFDVSLWLFWWFMMFFGGSVLDCFLVGSVWSSKLLDFGFSGVSLRGFFSR